MTKWERVFPVMNIVMSLPGFVLISRTSSFKSVMKLLHLGGGGVSVVVWGGERRKRICHFRIFAGKSAYFHFLA